MKLPFAFVEKGPHVRRPNCSKPGDTRSLGPPPLQAVFIIVFIIVDLEIGVILWYTNKE
jgi:hypothetical protein